jgi:cytochrome c oxidase assembly factor CtaG
MKLFPGWQDLVALLATLAAGAWLFRRWLVKRRAGKGCDQCAAMLHTRVAQRPAKSGPER